MTQPDIDFQWFRWIDGSKIWFRQGVDGVEWFANGATWWGPFEDTDAAEANVRECADT